ncbi:MAG: hypothetical protein I3270_00125 [Candidatus Moeniiplasma glomeromycotorum]|nr:hypothetical protein [Candidatus Moeniiplasma glomeromycotorum]MCE8166051.1 hypothetical protein [Candidatus Moeniiplasma glomeromycotorum]
MIDWEKEIKAQIRKNLLECEKKLDSKEYRTKIEKWCRKFGFDFDTILKKAKSDHYFRAFFAKDPKKQNIYEKVLIKYINSLDFVSNFQKLSSGGKNALYIDRGVVRKVVNILIKNQPNRLILLELSKTSREKLFIFMFFINTLKKAAEPRITNLTKLKNVLKLAGMVVRNQTNELFSFVMELISWRKKSKN